MEINPDNQTTKLDGEYPKEILVCLHAFRGSEQYTDVILKAGDVEIKCHRVILAAASTYFNTMFKSGLNESHADVVKLVGIDSLTLNLIIKYLYWSKIEIDIDNVQNLVQASDQFLLTRLSKECEEFMVQRVNPENTVGFYKFAEQYSLKNLKKAARSTMLKRFSEVVKFTEFCDMELSELIEYISDNALNVRQEDQVFEAACTWVLARPDERDFSFTQILEHIRLPQCTSSFLTQCVAPHPLMLQKNCQKYLDDAFRYKMMLIPHRTINNPRTIPRHTSSQGGCLILIGGVGTKWEWSKDIKFFRSGGTIWEELTQLPVGTADCGAVVIHNGIFITGGHSGNVNSPNNACYLFNVLLHQWFSMPPMIYGRYCHGSVVHYNEVYVAGGCSGFSDLCSVEIFDERCQQWSKMPNMPEVMQFVHAVSCEQYICVLGRASEKMFVFDTEVGKWEKRKDRPHEVFELSVTTLNGQIYVVGGNYCMSYDMHADSWAVLSSPSATYHISGSAAAWQGNLILAGGIATNIVDEYNPEENAWSVSPIILETPLCGHCLVTMDI